MEGLETPGAERNRHLRTINAELGKIAAYLKRIAIVAENLPAFKDDED